MTINDLISQIHASDSNSISVERLTLITGNTDGSGNHSIIKLDIGGEIVEFNNSTGVWAQGKA